MDKLSKLNKMKVIDYSISGGEVEYVAVENTEENRQILRDLGATEEDLRNMGIDEELLDISIFAFTKCDAFWWSSKEGFGYNETD